MTNSAKRLDEHQELLAPFATAQESAKAKQAASNQERIDARPHLLSQLNAARHAVSSYVQLVEELRNRAERLEDHLGALMDELGVPPSAAVRMEMKEAVTDLRRMVGQAPHPARDVRSEFKARCEKVTTEFEEKLRWRREPPRVGPADPVEQPAHTPGTTKNWWLSQLRLKPRGGSGYVIVPLPAVDDRPIHFRCDRDSITLPPPRLWSEGADSVLAHLFGSVAQSRRAHVTWTQGNQPELNPHLYWGYDTVRFPEGFPAHLQGDVTEHLVRSMDACRQSMLERVRGALAELASPANARPRRTSH